MTWYDRLLCRTVRLLVRLLQRRFSQAKGRVFTVRVFTTHPRMFVDRRLEGGVIVGFGDPSYEHRLIVVHTTRDQLEGLAAGLATVLEAQATQAEEVRVMDTHTCSAS